MKEPFITGHTTVASRSELIAKKQMRRLLVFLHSARGDKSQNLPWFNGKLYNLPISLFSSLSEQFSFPTEEY